MQSFLRLMQSFLRQNFLIGLPPELRYFFLLYLYHCGSCKSRIRNGLGYLFVDRESIDGTVSGKINLAFSPRPLQLFFVLINKIGHFHPDSEITVCSTNPKSNTKSNMKDIVSLLKNCFTQILLFRMFMSRLQLISYYYCCCQLGPCYRIRPLTLTTTETLKL